MIQKLLIMMAWLCLLWIPVMSLAQASPITIRLTETTGQPVPGAYISTGKNAQAIADAQGKFTLVLAPDAMITISAAGFKTKAVRVSDITNATIILEEDVSKLDEVVVTGLATTVKRRNLANAVVTLSPKELTGTAPAQTLDGALNGKIPGALINSNTGAPGGGISVKLRGVTSVYGTTQPLYVVDGVFVDNTTTSAGLNSVTTASSGGSPTSIQDNPSNRIADLRAEDIANVEILKGASAAAIYGSKAAAGVIIITTKRGKQGQTSITVSQAPLLTEMLKQRRYSLYFEGHRWLDLRRYNRLGELPVERPDDNVWTAFPLPVTEQ